MCHLERYKESRKSQMTLRKCLLSLKCLDSLKRNLIPCVSTIELSRGKIPLIIKLLYCENAVSSENKDPKLREYWKKSLFWRAYGHKSVS